jgi:hypothetical protein
MICLQDAEAAWAFIVHTLQQEGDQKTTNNNCHKEQ